MDGIKRTIHDFRKPDYTGENRCVPCTILNVLLAVSVAGSIALLWLPVGVVVLFGCLITITLRGYLVPGTPTLTARYLPDRVLRWFNKPERGEADDMSVELTGADGGVTTDSEIESLLREAGVVEPDPGTDDLRLTDRFRDRWWRRIERSREEDATERLAAVIEVDPRQLSIDTNEDGRVTVSFEGDVIGHWVSEAAFYADIAVESAFCEWLPTWDDLTDERRTRLIAGARAFLERCPRCEADLEPAENVRKSCCSENFVRVNVDCEECGSRVFTGSYR